MSKETFAIINDKDQVVNHILVDKDAPDFEQVMADQLNHWGCVRYVETTTEDVIYLHESPEIWTIHTEKDGFVPPQEVFVETPPLIIFDESTEEVVVEEVTINGRKYPKDSKLIKENAHLRQPGWVLPEGAVEVSLADAE